MSMFPSAWQIAVVVILIILLFGRGKISGLMSDLAKGIKSFKKGMSDNSDSPNQDSNNKDEKDNSSNN